MFKPTVGPIVGHTTTHQTRLFLRGTPRKNISVFAGIRYRRAGEVCWLNSIFAKLEPVRDGCEVIALNELSADTEYEYQAGWFSPAGPMHTVETAQQLPLQWPQDLYRFRTPSNTTTKPRAYIVGSCRYLRMTGGMPVLPHRSDRIFASIMQQVHHAQPPVSAVLMTGDQVYVDDLNIVAPDRELNDIFSKYRAAFSQPNISQLMSSVPTYMILDDHEIEDNWPANKSNKDDYLYTNAMTAYEIYQASHSPIPELLDNGRVSSTLNRYWYQFTEGDIEWFVTDSRTRRNLSTADRRILDQAQEIALCEWLINSSARVKFVVTSVMFYPDKKIQGDDAWKAFPEQRLRLLETIRQHRIKNVIFVSGDVHGSLTSRLTHSEDPDFEVHTVVSSPLSNSKLLPYANAASFILDQPLARTAEGEYRHALTGAVISQDNFAHLVVDAGQIRVSYHDHEGKLLQQTDIPLR
ncbi:alkaline phosphatase D family protein [Pseudomonas sp. TNT3]|uniref:alkaline phosphatase D family protein n=1 Tax=Pseudomonas sp. TNT3 TaxID=2654097 RepID=UPI0013910B60|nr:alkaline phosphatase D family protein [Pseudomonas sp. TNT3]KAI2670677.1 alkaline phosphatase family protein [Pseudomonas sp. TNT3]